MTETWWLYVDESGDFSNAHDCVVVAGLLLNQAATGTGEATLRSVLGQAAPHIPWPLHASIIHLPVAHAFWAKRAGPNQCSTELSRASADALEWAAQRSREIVDQVLGALAANREPSFGKLKTLDVALSGAAPDLHRVLSKFARDVMTRVHEVVRTLANGWLENGQAALFCAAEPLVGDAVPAGSSGDRYLSLLETLLERLLDFLDWAGDDHCVNLRVLRRNVRDPMLGATAPLHVRHLHTMVSELTGSPRGRLQGAHGAVKLAPVDTPAFDGTAHPGLVLADLTANRLRRAVFNGGNLDRLNRAVSQLTAFPVLNGPASLPTVAATGDLRRCVGAIRHRDAGPLPANLHALDDTHFEAWSRQQARRWMELLAQ